MLFFLPPTEPALSAPAPEEQYLLELINADRAKAGLQPLVHDPNLGEAADRHSRWMIASGVFSHTGAQGSSPAERMHKAGFQGSGPRATGENIAWASQREWDTYAAQARFLHERLMKSPGHRANLMDADFRKVGLGFQTTWRGQWRRNYLTENFGTAGYRPYLTGVAYRDLNGNRFYDPGEELAGVRVTAAAEGRTYVGVTRASGGYDIALPSGRYEVTFSGAGVVSRTAMVTVGSRNVKLDHIEPGDGARPAEAQTAEVANAEVPAI